MAEKKKLGKGLEAIFGSNLNEVINNIEQNVQNISDDHKTVVLLNEVRPNPYQPRKNFDDSKIQELASSIKEYGVFTPIIVKKAIKGYEIVAGERRVRAAKQAGLTEIPAIIVEFDDAQMREIALIENIQRENLNTIEEALAYKEIMQANQITQEQLAKKVGKSREYVANVLRLLKLPEFVQKMVLDGKLTMSHVRPLITIENEEKIVELAKRIIDEKLSVREVENICKALNLSKFKKTKKKEEKDKNIIYAENLLQKKFKTKVKIENNQITIKYLDDNDLNRLLEILDVIEDI